MFGRFVGERKHRFFLPVRIGVSTAPQFRAFVSSTIRDLELDRKVVAKALKSLSFVEVIGQNLSPSVIQGNSYQVTRKWARECDLYILLLGGRYGYEAATKKSATEVEFDAAYELDPTKILIFQNCSIGVEPRQAKFIERVGKYRSGFWINKYQQPQKLQKLVPSAVTSWLVARSGTGRPIALVDRFVMQVSNLALERQIEISYRFKGGTLELSVEARKRVVLIHFEEDAIRRDFWGCLYTVDRKFGDAWG